MRMSFDLIEDECWIWGAVVESSPDSNLPWKRFMIMGYEALSPRLSGWLLTPSAQYSASRGAGLQGGWGAGDVADGDGLAGPQNKAKNKNTKKQKKKRNCFILAVRWKVVWHTKSHILSYVCFTNRPSLGLWCLLLFISRFSRMLFEEGIRNSSSTVVGCRPYCWSLA